MVSENIGFPNGDSRNATGVVVLNGASWYLRPEAAGALSAANQAYRAEFGSDIPVNESLRDIDTQWYYWNRYQQNGSPVAAYPGSSKHGWGLAIDVDIYNNTQQRWLANNLPAYGWWWSGQNFGEPWHFDFDGRNLSQEQLNDYANGTTSGGFLMALTDEQQSNMYAWLQGLAYGNYPTANGYPFSARDAVQNNLETILGQLRAMTNSSGVDTQALADNIAKSLEPVLVAALQGVAPGASSEEVVKTVRDALDSSLKTQK